MYFAEWLCSIVSNGLNKMKRRLRLGGAPAMAHLPLLLLSWPFSPGPRKGCDCSICLSFFSLPSFLPEKEKYRKIERSIEDQYLYTHYPELTNINT